MRNFKHIKRKSLYIALLMVAVVLCTGCTEREEQQLEHRQKGITLMENGNYEEALESFQNALDLSLGEVGETEMDICFYKAEALYRLGDVQGTIDTYSAIIDYNQNAKAYFLRGNLYYSQNNEEDTNLLENLTAGNDSNPENIVLNQEALIRMQQLLKENLSKMENQVLPLYLEGLSYQDIATKLGKPVKSIDNAVQRIRDKVKKLYPKETE